MPLLLALLVLVFGVDALNMVNEPGWPREITAPEGQITVYQPQIESFQENDLTGRAAVSILLEGSEEPIFGAVWFSARVETNRDKREIYVLEVDVPRAKRLAGQPKMKLVSLITHGLSSIAVYGDIVGTRILLSVVALLVIVLLLLGSVLVIRMFTNWGIPGWATYVSGILVLSVFQLVLIGTVFCMIVLSTRNQFNFIPVRDYGYYVDDFFELKP